MYEARQNKEKVSRRIDANGGMQQRVKSNSYRQIFMNKGHGDDNKATIQLVKFKIGDILYSHSNYSELLNTLKSSSIVRQYLSSKAGYIINYFKENPDDTIEFENNRLAINYLYGIIQERENKVNEEQTKELTTIPVSTDRVETTEQEANIETQISGHTIILTYEIYQQILECGINDQIITNALNQIAAPKGGNGLKIKKLNVRNKDYDIELKIQGMGNYRVYGKKQGDKYILNKIDNHT